MFFNAFQQILLTWKKTDCLLSPMLLIPSDLFSFVEGGIYLVCLISVLGRIWVPYECKRITGFNVCSKHEQRNATALWVHYHVILEIEKWLGLTIEQKFIFGLKLSYNLLTISNFCKQANTPPPVPPPHRLFQIFHALHRCFTSSYLTHVSFLASLVIETDTFGKVRIRNSKSNYYICMNARGEIIGLVSIVQHLYCNVHEESSIWFRWYQC